MSVNISATAMLQSALRGEAKTRIDVPRKSNTPTSSESDLGKFLRFYFNV